jgi:hypothetical protein
VGIFAVQQQNIIRIEEEGLKGPLPIEPFDHAVTKVRGLM